MSTTAAELARKEAHPVSAAIFLPWRLSQLSIPAGALPPGANSMAPAVYRHSGEGGGNGGSQQRHTLQMED